jgi:hypothetical protein
VENIRSSETLLTTYKTTPGHNSDDNNPHFYSLEHIKCRVKLNAPDNIYRRFPTKNVIETRSVVAGCNIGTKGRDCPVTTKR